MENETFDEYLKRKTLEKNNALLQIKRSNSDTKFYKIKHYSEKTRRKIQKSKTITKEILAKRQHSRCSSCEHCHTVSKLIKKDKRRLRDYILDNKKYVKLIGNRRYNDNPPALYIQDHNKNLDDKKIGLIPLPTKSKKKIKSNSDKQRLYDLQRSIVMMRRFQYNKQYLNNDFRNNNNFNIIDLDCVIIIQKWWKKIFKIIKIQKIWRAHFIRKEIYAVRKLYFFMEKFENTLNEIKVKKCFNKIKNFENLIFQKPKINSNFNINNNFESFGNKNNDYFFMTKKTNLINEKIKHKIITIQKNYKNHFNFVKNLILNKDKIKKHLILNYFFVTKIYINPLLINNKICLIQKYFHQFLLTKKKFKKKIVFPLQYTKKIYQRPTLTVKKIQKFYKNYQNKKEFNNILNEEDFNKIIYNQNKPNSFFTKITINKNSIDNYLNNSNNNNNDNNNNINYNLIENKFSKIIFPFTNKICFISKEYKTSFMNKLLKLQKYIKKWCNKNIETSLLNIDYKSTGYYSQKIRTRNNLNNILFLQTSIKGYLNKKNEIIKEKPINSSSILFNNDYNNNDDTINEFNLNNNNNNFNNNNNEFILSTNSNKEKNLFNKNNLNYENSNMNYSNLNNSNLSNLNNSDFVSKKNIKNVNDKVIKLQRKIKSYLILKKIKEIKNDINNYKQIKKNNLNKFYFITKIINNKLEQMNKITLIQKYFKSKLNNNNNIIKKHLVFLTTPLIKRKGDLTEIDINFSDENSNNNFSVDEINLKKKKNNNDSLISNESKINKTFLNNNNNFILNKELNSSFLNNSGYISKVVKKNVKIIKKKNLNELSFISKKVFIEKNNYELYNDFINFIELLITKHFQEKIFYLLKDNTNHFNKCFYIKTLKKVLKFHQIYKNKENKVSKFINKIFPNLNNSNINKLISKLNDEQKNDLANTNIFENNLDQDFIKYLNDFSSFDKNLSNELFIINRLKNSYLTNTNIFSITKFIDNEYENLIEGKYCMKCYQSENICDCLQKNLEIEESFNFIVNTKNLEDEFEEIIKKDLPEFSGYISKIIIKPTKLIKKNDLNHLFFISKTFYIKQNPEINIDFIKLLKLHLIKNSQQFVFYKLKLFKEIDFNNSFYILTLQRILKYCKSNPKKQSKVQTFINNVFPNINNKTINKLISNLTQEQQKQLSNSNIYTSIEQDFIKYLNDFSSFDKNLSNELFIINRLKNSYLTNTNIFSITKFIDNEYENLIEGKYCMKCYQSENICDCLQKKTIEDEEDYTIDLEMNDDDASKCIVNHFEYDSTKVKGILIKRKPKIEENYEDPITNLINKRKYFTTNNSKENEKKKSNFIFKSNFNNNSNNLINSQNENNNNNNIIENNFLFNSNNNINVIASNDSINNSLSNNNINNNRYNNNNINVNNSDSINIGNSQEFVTNAQNRNNNIIDLKKLYHSDKNNKKANQVIIRGDNNSNGSSDKNNLKYFY